MVSPYPLPPPDAGPGAVLVLDGGTATTLESAGHDLSGPLWSARLLRDDPDGVRGVHEAFLAAGAQVVTTASYQLSAESLAAAGADPVDAPRLLAGSVEVAHRAVAAVGSSGARRALVAASVGPYGAARHDGSEYRGGYGRTRRELEAFHRPRIEALAAAGPDVLACETIPSAVELAALATVLAETALPAYVSVTLGHGGRVTAEGQPLRAAFSPLLDVAGVVAIGVNCCSPSLVVPALEELGGLGLPLIAKPNAGSRWDPLARAWRARAARDPDPAGAVAGWVSAGARLVGGCCGTSPADLRRLASAWCTAGPADRPEQA